MKKKTLPEWRIEQKCGRVNAVRSCKRQHKNKLSRRFSNSWLSGSFKACQLFEKHQRWLNLFFAQY
jgi:hypothetical protein